MSDCVHSTCRVPVHYVYVVRIIHLSGSRRFNSLERNERVECDESELDDPPWPLTHHPNPTNLSPTHPAPAPAPAPTPVTAPTMSMGTSVPLMTSSLAHNRSVARVAMPMISSRISTRNALLMLPRILRHVSPPLVTSPVPVRNIVFVGSRSFVRSFVRSDGASGYGFDYVR